MLLTALSAIADDEALVSKTPTLIREIGSLPTRSLLAADLLEPRLSLPMESLVESECGAPTLPHLIEPFPRPFPRRPTPLALDRLCTSKVWHSC